MSIQIRNSETLRKTLTGLGIIACASCCLLPLIGTGIAGITMLSLTGMIEKIGLGILLLAILLYMVHFIRKRRRGKACQPESCSCKTTASSKEVNSL